MSYYEKVFSASSKLPITYHKDTNTINRYVGFHLHWHEHIEILYFSKGTGIVYVNNVPIQASEGEIVVISSNMLHAMPSKLPNCTYHCIIINKVFIDNILGDKDIFFKEHITDIRVINLYEAIIKEMAERGELFQSQAAAYCSLLLGELARNFAYSERNTVSMTKSPKQKLVKKAMAFIMRNYKGSLSIEAIAEYIGCSKYYLCHIFKEVTGQTMIDYINILRCSQVKRFILDENYSITEAAYSSGFNNLSYFTKIYKKYMGILPSQEKENMMIGSTR
ncbi:AraC family transcriptional regulator [Paludicola sp. MB14-C6]|uniref:AraC family transcriptional regulator n=1 Tax=Paludihabitans sp. MB14-C6 TaxID=3070656 RepID=UPI0027DDDBBD|nr:AraC family transcriptional regulator [Paludicola sp. MB14-C6]WMJ22973.1 AraC family transcriptional regulator [Paludicola sp. MB14-C6]